MKQERTPLPKGFTALLTDVYAVLRGQAATVSQAVHVKDGHEVVQTVVGSEGQGLPHGAFQGLAVSQEAEHPVAAASQERFRAVLGHLSKERGKGTEGTGCLRV